MKRWPTIAATSSASTSRRPRPCGSPASIQPAPTAPPARRRRSADPTRLTLAWALAETDEACVCDLAWVMERAENLVSHHLKILRRAELVTNRREGKMVLYSLTPRGRELVELAVTAEAPGMTELALPTLPQVERREPPAPSAEWLAAAKRARMLSWLSLVWMGLEGGIALFAGIVAGSIALIGFGIDSAIEGVASVIIIWRFTGARMLSARRRGAGPEAGGDPVLPARPLRRLRGGRPPDRRRAARGQRARHAADHLEPDRHAAARAGRSRAWRCKLGSQATHGEGTQNLLCAYLAAAVLAGLLGNALFGAWWLDPVAALFIAVVAVREGLETWRGEGCCVEPARTSIPPA